LADARTIGLLFALGATMSACMADHHPSYNPPVDQCPTISDPAAGVMIDTDIGAKLTPATGDSVSVEYSSGGLWHVQSTCLSGYACEWEVTAEVFNGSVSNVMGEDLETNDSVGSVCPDTAFMTVSTAADLDGMIFTTAPGAKIRLTAALDHSLYANLIIWADGGKVRNDANSNPLDLTPVSP